MKINRIFIKTACVFTAASAIILTLPSCSSLQQDVIISSIPKEEISEISDFEFRLANIDANYSFTYQSDPTERNTACEALIKDINKYLKNNSPMKAAQARLTAIIGRAYLIEEKYDSAKNSEAQAESHYKGDIQTQILSHRLGTLKNLNDIQYQSSDKAVVLIEQAIDYFKAKDFASSVAKFDEAFITAEGYYHDAYQQIRDEAWNMRLVKDDSDISSLLAKKDISIIEMMQITQSYPKIIGLYSDSASLNDTALFRKLKNAGLLTAPLKNTPPSKIFPSNKATRKLSARYLWNLYCDWRHKPGLKNKYSEFYSNSKNPSPVKDINKDDEDFDAVLGCVEYDLMKLSDGVNFKPNGTVSGAEINNALKKLK